MVCVRVCELVHERGLYVYKTFMMRCESNAQTEAKKPNEKRSSTATSFAFPWCPPRASFVGFPWSRTQRVVVLRTPWWQRREGKVGECPAFKYCGTFSLVRGHCASEN
jgi:hypothetical protein